MTTKYYIISADDARLIGVTEFRNGNEEKGYVVNGGDIEKAPRNVKRKARLVSENEALDFVSNLKKQ